jgi:hypothetical protein
LAEATPFVGRHFGVDNLSKAPKNVAEVLLIDPGTQPPNEDGGVGGVEVRGVGDACKSLLTLALLFLTYCTLTMAKIAVDTRPILGRRVVRARMGGGDFSVEMRDVVHDAIRY